MVVILHACSRLSDLLVTDANVPVHDTSVTAQQTQNICITFIQCWANVEDVGPTLYKCYANAVLRLLSGIL